MNSFPERDVSGKFSFLTVRFSQTDGAFGGGGVDDSAFLEDVDFALGDESTGGLAGAFHFIAPAVSGEYGARGFTGADGGTGSTLGEEFKNGGFERVI